MMRSPMLYAIGKSAAPGVGRQLTSSLIYSRSIAVQSPSYSPLALLQLQRKHGGSTQTFPTDLFNTQNITAMNLTAASPSPLSIAFNCQQRSITSSALTIERTTNPRPKVSKEKLTFGKTLSDHMLVIEWDKNEKWHTPKIIPYQNLSLSPAASVLHYGLEAFEGMKAYRTIPTEKNDNDSTSIRLFRPDCNMERLSTSMERLHFPCHDFNREELLACIMELIRVDADWIPQGEGYSLYIRPTVIATNPFLGLSSPEKVMLYCITSPVGPYYKTGFNPVRLTTDTPYVRAWPGGTGGAKVGGNYASTMKAAALAAVDGYDQILWLFGEEKTITEVGAMNVFFFLANADTGRKELVTPPLIRGDILPGVTRRAILDLAREWNEFDVVERFPTMNEIRDAGRQGRLLEAFGAGTAAVVSPISCIRYEGEDIAVKATGPLTKRVWDEITSIQYGKVVGPEGWSIIV